MKRKSNKKNKKRKKSKRKITNWVKNPNLENFKITKIKFEKIHKANPKLIQKMNLNNKQLSKSKGSPDKDSD